MTLIPLFVVRRFAVVAGLFFAVSGVRASQLTPELWAPDFGNRGVLSLGPFEAAGSDIKLQHPRGGQQVRSAIQSFAWLSDRLLAGVGVQIGQATVWGAAQTQDYELRVFSYDPGATPPVAEPAVVFTFQMKASLAKPGHWLYLGFPEPVRLDRTKGHVFQLAAVSPGGSILALKSSHGAGNPYAKGIGAQHTSNAPSVPSAGGAWDFAFFLTAGPDAGSDVR